MIEGRFSDGIEQFNIVLENGRFKLSVGEIAPEEDSKSPQQIIAEALDKDPSLSDFSSRDLAKHLGLTYYQVQKFRKQLIDGIASVAEKAD